MPEISRARAAISNPLARVFRELRTTADASSATVTGLWIRSRYDHLALPVFLQAVEMLASTVSAPFGVALLFSALFGRGTGNAAPGQVEFAAARRGELEARGQVRRTSAVASL